MRYQNELGLQVYDTVENVSGICFFLAVLFPNVPELGVEREDTKQKKNRNDDYKSTAHLLRAIELACTKSSSRFRFRSGNAGYSG